MDPSLRKVFVPIFGAKPDFQEHTAFFVEPDGQPRMIFRPFEPPSRLHTFDFLRKFRPDDLSAGNAVHIAGPGMEVEYRVDWADARTHALVMQHFVRLIGLKANAILSAPLYSSHSLGDLAAADNGSVTLQVFCHEDLQVRRGTSRGIAAAAIEWANTHMRSLPAILEQRRVNLAFHIANAERTAPNPAMSLLTAWSGLETLFAIDREQTFRLSLMLAYYLETDPKLRKQVFDEARSSYNARSAVTHGRKIKDEDVNAAVGWTIQTLRRCLVRAIESGALPETDSLFFA
ncbi:hypothetical protein BH10PSE6_BH10PSE6_04290 [soil metagenome]